MMIPRKVAEFHEEVNHVSHDLLKAIAQLRDKDTRIVNDIVGSFTYKWAFECKLDVLGFFHSIYFKVQTSMVVFLFCLETLTAKYV